MDDAIASASLLYGESATMASEAAVLGVPAIYLDNTGRCYTREEEEKYGLVFNFTEGVQYFLTYRSYNINDLLSNFLGVLLGSIALFFIPQINQK